MSAIELFKTALLSDPHLKYYFRFESGKLEDGSNPPGFTGQLTNLGAVTSAAGKFGNGAVIASNLQWLRCTNTAILGNSLTMMAWIKVNTEPVSQQYNVVYLGQAGKQVAYWIDYEYNGGTRRLNFARYKYGVATQYSFYNVTLGTAAYHLVALTYDGVKVRGYLDGVEVVETAYAGDGSGASITSLIQVAQDFVNGDENANHGIYDDAIFLDRPLSSDEIAQYYAGNLPANGGLFFGQM